MPDADDNYFAASGLKVFLCHASVDKTPVRELYHRLLADGFEPWLDEESLLPGQNWREEIPKAVRNSDIVLVCLSKKSIDKDGYVQKEIRFALDKADEKPEGAIFIIPLKLEECPVPDRISQWHWVNYFERNGYERLTRALRAQAQRAPREPTTAAPSDLDADRQQMLDLEISHRLAPLPTLLADVFTYTQLHTAKGAMLGRSEYHPKVGKLGEFEPLFAEFQNKSLFQLIWELRQTVPEPERTALKQPLEAARRLPHFFDKLVLLVPVGAEDSKWQMDRQFIAPYKDVLKGFDIGRWNT
jgi:hypothetical protein